jgi:hypothetical protein
MRLKHLVSCSGLWLLCVGGFWADVAWAGMLGSPVPRQQAFHFRFELAGDSFKEQLQNSGDAEATSGRGLVSVVFGLTNWSEIYVRAGLAEFNVDEALFRGDYGFAYGGGVRLRLLPLPFGSIGLAGQYLRFTSDDDNSVGDLVEGEWEEIDLAVGMMTRRFGPFEFYFGGAYHQSEITLDRIPTGTRTTLETEIPFRIFFGAHFYPLGDFPSGKFVVTVEARVIGETPQFTLGVQYAF